MSYSQLTQDQRYQIYELSHEGKTPGEIAQALGVHRTTISRELTRNAGAKGYRPHQAHALATVRRLKPRRPCLLTEPVRQNITEKLQEDWSPEQIAGQARRQGKPTVGKTRIYQMIWEDKKAGGKLHVYLRRANKLHRKGYGKAETRGQLRNQISIELRPAVVQERSRLGDWELDTVLGTHGPLAVVTFSERFSRLTLAAKVTSRSAAAVTQAIVDTLTPLKSHVLTLTSDNGSEFAAHERIAAALDAQFYFAHPHAAWERGLCENTNGLLRQYLPRGTSLQSLTATQLDQYVERLNHRPRKSLGYATPHEVFFSCANLAPPHVHL